MPSSGPGVKDLRFEEESQIPRKHDLDTSSELTIGMVEVLVAVMVPAPE